MAESRPTHRTARARARAVEAEAGRRFLLLGITLLVGLAVGLSIMASLARADEPGAARDALTQPAPDTGGEASRARWLDDLFADLKHAESEARARVIQSTISRLWSTYEGPDPGVMPAFERARRAMMRHDLEAAERWFTDAVERAPAFVEGWNKRATVRYLRGDYDGSIADISRTLSLEPRHYGALAGLGMILMDLDRPFQAAAAFEQALAQNPYLPGVQKTLERLRGEIAKRTI